MVPLIEPGTLEAIGLVMIRTTTLVLAAPVLAGWVAFTSIKVSLIVALTGILFISNGEPLAVVPGPLEFSLLAAREIGIGLTLALALEMGVVAVRVGADLIGHEMGFTMAQIVDPQFGNQKPVLSQFYENLFLLGMFALEGHHWLIRALGDSTERAPVGRMEWSQGPTALAVDLLSEMFTAGITFAAPVLVFLTLITTLIGLLTRAVPQLNVIEFSFNMRIGLGLGLMFLFAPLLTPALERLFELVSHGVEASLETLAAI